ncbi:MAG: efflux RND transporter periplasmic adaptor subunit [Candidatus Tyrphobacter sp.]
MTLRVAAVLCAALTLAACGHGARGRGFRGFGGSPAPVPTAVASTATVHPLLTISGIIAPYQNVMLSSDLVEPADLVAVNEGDHVHRGQLLAQLDTADLRAQLAADQANTTHTIYQGRLSISQGAAALQQAQTTLHNDRLNLVRDEQLFKQGYIARQTLDAQVAVVRNDEQAVHSDAAAVAANGSLASAGLQSSAVAQARAAAQQVQVQIAKATITSPVDGTVVNRNLNPGEYPGSRTIFVVQQDNTVYAELNASSADVFRIHKGSPVTLTVPGSPGRPYAGTVVGVLGQVQPGSTNFTVKVLVPRANGALVAGLPVTGTIALQPTTGIGVPSTSFLDDSHSTLFTVASNGTAQEAHVTELATDGTTSIVRGLASGTKVVSNGQLGITAGQQLVGGGQGSGSAPPGGVRYRRR